MRRRRRARLVFRCCVVLVPRNAHARLRGPFPIGVPIPIAGRHTVGRPGPFPIDMDSTGPGDRARHALEVS
jgi:hypothetical protein